MECFPEYAYAVPRRAPLLVASVCRYWRELVLFTPTLWRSIDWELHSYRTQFTSIVSFARLWRERAAHCLLHLTLRITIEGLRPVLGIFIDKPEQLEVLSLTLPSTFFCELADMKGRLPHLRTLRLSSPAPDMQYPADLCDVFMEAPSLRVVSLQTPPPWLCLPWSQLTEFEATRQPVDEFLGLLAWADRLERCTVCEPLAPVARLEQVPTVTSYVHTLSVSGGEAHTLLDHLTLPALRRLHIQTRTQPFTPTTADELLPLFSPIPTLAALHITAPSPYKAYFTDTFFAGLEFRAGHAPLLPRLRSVEFTGRFACQRMDFADMLQSRRDLPSGSPLDLARLEEVKLTVKRRLNAATTKTLYRLKLGGLRLSFGDCQGL